MKKLSVLVFIGLLQAACSTEPTARPNGFMRIGLPNKQYEPLALFEGCSFSSKINTSAVLRFKDSANCWIDIIYPSLMSTIQLTYKPINNNINDLVRDAQKLAYKHTVKASGMREQLFLYDSAHVYGMYYEMSGASAATTQFYATDSANHFLRGVLYHYSVPNPDSLAPVTNFMRKEILELIANLHWDEH